MGAYLGGDRRALIPSRMVSLRPTLRQVLVLAALHLVVAGLLAIGAMAMALDFSRDGSVLRDAFVAVGLIGVYPVMAVFLPAFDAVLPQEPALVLAAVVNSLLWGVALAFLVNAVRRWRGAP